MRKFLIISACILIGCAYSPIAYASGDPCESNFLKYIVNDCSPHTVDTDTQAEQRDQAGVGADVVVWQNDTDKLKFIEEVVAEYRYDIDNEAHSIYGVVRVNLWQKLKGLLKRD